MPRRSLQLLVVFMAVISLLSAILPITTAFGDDPGVKNVPAGDRLQNRIVLSLRISEARKKVDVRRYFQSLLRHHKVKSLRLILPGKK